MNDQQTTTPSAELPKKKKRAPEPWTPPRGIRYTHRPDRPKPFRLHWIDDTGAEKAESFADEEKRETAAKALADKRDRHGSDILRFDPEKWRRWLDFERIVGAGVDPLVVAHEWKASRQGGTSGASALQVAKAVERYLLLRKTEKSWGDSAGRHAKKHLEERFCDTYGTKRLNEVGADDVRAWLRELVDDDGEPIGEHGIKDHLKHVRTFFDYARREKWGVVDNPCEFIKLPKPDDGDVTVIPLRDAFEFFRANRDERLIGRVAMEAFGGIRYTTAGRIAKEYIRQDAKGIRMLGRIHKSGQKDGRTRYRQGQPENLWAWLKHTPDATWGMTLLNYREEKRYALIRAGLRPFAVETEEDGAKLRGLRNIWRHSFASYHLARFKSLPLTQYLMQHQNSATTEIYEGVADETDAARFFMITPETVKLTWDEFKALPLPQLSSVPLPAVTVV